MPEGSFFQFVERLAEILFNMLHLTQRVEQQLTGVGERQIGLSLKQAESALALQRFKVSAQALTGNKQTVRRAGNIQRFC